MRALALLLLFACYDEPSYENLRCSPALPCPAGLSCVDERCTRPEKDAGMLEESDCAPCDLPLAVCAENDSVYRSYVNIGACPDDPAQCIFVAFDMPCDDLQGGCRTAGYCVPGPSGVACAYVEAIDSSTCTTDLEEAGLCRSGVCIADPSCDPAMCDDGNPCTDDSCGPGGCMYEPNQAPCSDEDPCTFDDQCSDRSCRGTPITCESDDCTERACDGTPTCSEQPRALDTPCADDANACTRDVCNGSGACVHPALPNGTQCGAQENRRCCGTECVNISTDERHCGGCNTACDQGFACEPIESTPDCGASYPPQVSGRCLCQGANSQCPDNRGQVCRLTQYLDGNRCVPDSSTAMPCSNGQTVEVIDMCPGYCAY